MAYGMRLERVVEVSTDLTFSCVACNSELKARREGDEIAVEVCATCRKDYEDEAYHRGKDDGDEEGYQRGFNDHKDMCETCRQASYDLGWAECKAGMEAER